MEDWRNPSAAPAQTNGFDHYANYNGRNSWGGRSCRSHSRPRSRRGSRDDVIDATPMSAKGHKSKSNKRHQRQEQHQQRQAAGQVASTTPTAVPEVTSPVEPEATRPVTPTPPTPAPVPATTTPVSAPVVEQDDLSKKQEKLEEPKIILSNDDNRKIDERVKKPKELVEKVNDEKRKERVTPPPPAAHAHQVVDSKPAADEPKTVVVDGGSKPEKAAVETEKKEEKLVEEEKQNGESEKKQLKKEELHVAAMNEENKKMSAVKSMEKTQQQQQQPTQNQELENNNIDNKLTNNNNVTVVMQQVTEPPQVIEPPKPVAPPKPSYNYIGDQWSPSNPEGKKRYERDFIMQLMHDPQSKKRPDNLPYLELLKDGKSKEMGRGGGGGGGSMTPRHGGDMLMPAFSKSSSLSRGQVMAKQRLSTGKMRPNKPMPIQVSLSLNDDVKLRESENAWKPSRVVDHANMTEDDKKTDSLYKKVRGVLNKLTPQKFQTLLRQVQALPIDTVPRLRGVIDIIFEKAVDEPGFCVAYADLCQQLTQMTIVDTEAPAKADGTHPNVNFRNLLLQKCQHQFEADSKEGINRNERKAQIELQADPEVKKEMTLQLEEDERRVRIKDVGNIRFVGELFKKKMLAPPVVYSCVETLLKHNTEESLECLCKLLTTTGRSLDEATSSSRSRLIEEKNSSQSVNAVPSLDKPFNTLQELVKNKEKNKLSSRVRFMIQDLLDLRQRKWVPRRDESNPKTMDQIVKEAEREQLESNLAISAMQDKRSGGGGGGGGPRMDNRPAMANKRGSETGGGWTQVGSGGTRNNKFQVETSKIRLAPNDMNDMSFGSRNQFMWNQPNNNESKNDLRNKPMMGGSNVSMTHNKYALLSDTGRQGGPPSRTSSLKGTAPPSAQASTPPPFNRNPPGAIAVNKMHDAPPRLDSMNPANRDVAPTNSNDAAPVEHGSSNSDDGAALDRLRLVLIQEFMNRGDFQDALYTFNERFSKTNLDDFVFEVFLELLEKAGPLRRAASRLFTKLFQAGSLSRSNILTGLSKVLEMVEDLIIDIPKTWEYLGELTVDIVHGGLGLAPIVEALGPCAKGPLKSVSTLLRIIHSERPDSPVLATAVPVLTEYLGGPQQFSAFVDDYNVQFLTNVSQEASKPRPLDEARTEELRQLLRDKAPYDVILGWVSQNVHDVTDASFIRTLSTAILEVTIVKSTSDKLKVDRETLENNHKLLTRFVDNVEERELQCLLALETIIINLEHPKGILLELCTYLSEQGIVCSETFKKWGKTETKGGHGVCVKALTSFLLMLNEGDEDDSS